MIKLIFCLRRKDGMTLDAFQTYWRETHAPLVAKYQEVLGIRRYVQSHMRETVLDGAIRDPRRGGAAKPAEPYDGVAELWYDSVDAMVANGSNPAVAEASKALLEDEAKFIDLANSPIFLAEEAAIL